MEQQKGRKGRSMSAFGKYFIVYVTEDGECIDKELIRCRDCKHHHGRWCQRLGADHLIEVHEDDYCSQAEPIYADN